MTPPSPGALRASRSCAAPSSHDRQADRDDAAADEAELRAAPRERSITRLRVNGPRSLTRTSRLRFVSMSVTRSCVPNGKERWAAVSAPEAKRSPLACGTRPTRTRRHCRICGRLRRPSARCRRGWLPSRSRLCRRCRRRHGLSALLYGLGLAPCPQRGSRIDLRQLRCGRLDGGTLAAAASFADGETPSLAGCRLGPSWSGRPPGETSRPPRSPCGGLTDAVAGAQVAVAFCCRDACARPTRAPVASFESFFVAMRSPSWMTGAGGKRTSPAYAGEEADNMAIVTDRSREAANKNAEIFVLFFRYADLPLRLQTFTLH